MKNYKNKNPRYKSDEKSVVTEPRTSNYDNQRKCLYCYERLRSEEEYFHAACAKRFFGQNYVPVFDYDKNSLATLAQQFVNAKMVVTGVQPKVSLSWHAKKDRNTLKKLTIVGLYGDFILKPQSDYYASLPELESCTMKMANVCGLKTVQFSLFALNDNTLCYLTKRVDRTKTGMRHMEDMCQLTERLTEDKYKGSHEQVAKALLKFSDTPLLDVSNFYEYVVFCFLTGNSDMHLKNFSILESAEPNKYNLCAAYDLLSTAIVNKHDTEELALTLNGKKSNLKYADFLAAFTPAGLTKKFLDQTLENFYYCRYEMLEILHKSFLPQNIIQDFEILLLARFSKLGF